MVHWFSLNFEQRRTSSGLIGLQAKICTRNRFFFFFRVDSSCVLAERGYTYFFLNLKFWMELTFTHDGLSIYFSAVSGGHVKAENRTLNPIEPKPTSTYFSDVSGGHVKAENRTTNPIKSKPN